MSKLNNDENFIIETAYGAVFRYRIKRLSMAIWAVILIGVSRLHRACRRSRARGGMPPPCDRMAFGMRVIMPVDITLLVAPRSRNAKEPCQNSLGRRNGKYKKHKNERYQHSPLVPDSLNDLSHINVLLQKFPSVMFTQVKIGQIAERRYRYLKRVLRTPQRSRQPVSVS